MGGAIGSGLGSQTSPIYIRNTGADWKEWAQGAVKSLVVFFVAATIISSFLDLSNFSKIMPATNVNVAETTDKRFSDVVGIDEAKNELQEIVMYLKNPGLFTRLGGKLPKGLMLTGPPGTGVLWMTSTTLLLYTSRHHVSLSFVFVKLSASFWRTSVCDGHRG